MKKLIFTICILLVVPFINVYASEVTLFDIPYSESDNIQVNQYQWVMYFTADFDNISSLTFSASSTNTVDLRVYICKGPLDNTATWEENITCTGNAQSLILSEDFSSYTYINGLNTLDITDTQLIESAVNYYYSINIMNGGELEGDASMVINIRNDNYYTDGQACAYNFNCYSGIYDFVTTVKYDDEFVPAPELGADTIEWYFPQQDYELTNSEWNDWGLHYKLGNSFEYALIQVIYSDIYDTYADYDFVSTTTDEVIYWTIDRSVDLQEGNVTAYGTLWGTNLENCTDPNQDSCIWYAVADLEQITFVASSTGQTIWDFGEVGFTPSTSTILDLWGASSTAEMNFFQSTFYNSLDALKYVFPFNIGAMVYLQWNESADLDIPEAFDFLDIADENHNIYLDLDDELFGSSSQMLIFGEDLFYASEDIEDFLINIKNLSTYALWIMFMIGLGWRGYNLYEEYH